MNTRIICKNGGTAGKACPGCGLLFGRHKMSCSTVQRGAARHVIAKPLKRGAAKLALASMSREQIVSANRAASKTVAQRIVDQQHSEAVRRVQEREQLQTAVVYQIVAQALRNARPRDLYTNEERRSQWYADCTALSVAIANSIGDAFNPTEFFDIAGVPS
jgi:hypothetical protein